MKNIFIGTTPNIQKDDLSLIGRILWRPWTWRNNEKVREFESAVETYMAGGEDSKNNSEFKAFAFDSARSSFYQILKAWGIGEGDEVLVPSFTCVVIINSVMETGAKPIYVDVNFETFNMDLADLEKKRTDKTRAVLAQHTFGIPMNVDKMRTILGGDVKIVEDLAHVMGAEVDSKKVGTHGDAAILTFGIEKAMTTLRGGMALVRKSDKVQISELTMAQDNANEFSLFRIWQWLINPFLWTIATPTYYWGAGKISFGRIISQLGHRFGLMGNMMESCEYSGCFPSWMPAKMPGALAEIGLGQLKKLDKFNEHRRNIAKIYDDAFGKNYSAAGGYTPLRYPLIVDDSVEVHRKMRENHFIIGNWYNKILFTDPKYLDILGFDKSSCPNTVKITGKMINLPTFVGVSEDDARRVVETINS